MKAINRFLFVILAMMLPILVSGQKIGDLHGINYQAVAIDDEGKEIVGMDIEGKPLYEKEIGVRFSVLKGEAGEVLYQETHTTLTDQYGLFSLVIGKGNQTGLGQYTHLLDIPWIDADQWLKVELSINNDGNYKLTSLQQFMTVPYSFYTDDIADNAILTEKILDEEIKARDIDTGAVETSEILNETILAEDIGEGSVESPEILNETILAEDIGEGSVESSEILNETIVAEDVAPGAITSDEILNSTLLNEDIADNTINLQNKVADTLQVVNGGTGTGALADNSILIGNGTGAIDTLGVAADGQIPIGVSGGKPVLANITAGTGISVINSPGGITLENTITGGVNSNANTNINPGLLSPGEQWISQAFVIQQPADLAPIAMGDLLLASVDVNLQGCLMDIYLTDVTSGVAHARVVIYNPGSNSVNLGNNVFVKILVVK